MEESPDRQGGGSGWARPGQAKRGPGLESYSKVIWSHIGSYSGWNTFRLMFQNDHVGTRVKDELVEKSEPGRTRSCSRRIWPFLCTP